MSSLIKVVFFLVDVLLLNIAMGTTFYVRTENFLATQHSEVVHFVIFSNIAWLFLVLVSTPYGVNKSWTLSKTAKNQLSFLFIHLLVSFSLVSFLNKRYDLFQMVSFYVLFAILFFGYRIAFYFFRKLVVTGNPQKGYLIIGRNQLSYDVRRFYLLNPELQYRFLGYVDFDDNGFPLSKIQQSCADNDVHEIICCAPQLSDQVLAQLVQFGLDSLIKVKLMFNNTVGSNSLAFGDGDRHPGIDIALLPIDRPVNQLLKRVFDLLFTTVFFVLVLSWLLPIVALLIKLDSRGSVFFVQQRNGLGNNPFGCIKFRTMVVNNDADTKQATKNDSRITTVGKFLRKSSIDEMPQFINVLLGNMSLIGPRPHPIKLNEKFIPMIANLMSRHYVKPGITGLAQCMGYRGETSTLEDMDNRVRLDRYYIENWTFWLDIKIIFLTVVSLIRGSDKAY